MISVTKNPFMGFRFPKQKSDPDVNSNQTQKDKKSPPNMPKLPLFKRTSSQPVLSSREAVTVDFLTLPISNNKEIDNHFNKHLKGNFNPLSPLNAQHLARKVDIVAKEIIKKNNLSSPIQPISHNDLIIKIQYSNTLISNIQKKISKIIVILDEYSHKHGARTEKLTTIRDALEELSNIEENLVTFVYQLENCKNNRSKDGKEIWKILSMALRDDQGETEPIFSVLKQWANPKKNEEDLLNQHINNAALIDSIPGTMIPWEEKEKPNYPINAITPYDVVRSIFPYTTPIMDSILINKNLFEIKDEDKESFFKRLLTSLYQNGYPSNSNQDTETDVQSLLKAEKFSGEQVKEYLTEYPLPILDILRPYTMNCWANADEVIKDVFPSPYFAQLQKGIKCVFSVSDPADPSVTTSKTYKIFFSKEKQSPDSFPKPDLERELCELVFGWKLYKKNSGWKGSLVIENVIWNTLCSTDKERLELAKRIKSKAAQYSPLKPKKNLTPRPNILQDIIIQP